MLIDSKALEAEYDVLSPEQLEVGMRCFRALGFAVTGPGKGALPSWSLVEAVVLSVTHRAKEFYEVKYDIEDAHRPGRGRVMNVLLPHENLKLVRRAVAVGCRRVGRLEVEEE